MNLCKNCKFYRPRNFEYIQHRWFAPGERLPNITYEDMCGHENFLSLVDGSPKYSCEKMRENVSDSRCGIKAKYFEAKQNEGV